MKRYIKYYIKTLEPVKLAGQGTQQGTVITRNFIQGSAIRGIIIGAFLRKYPGVRIDEDLQTREQFLTGSKFYNAYIAEGEQMSVPVPFVYRASKEAKRKAGDTEVQYSLGDGKDEIGESMGRKSFCIFQKDKVKIVPVKKMEQLHIQKAEEKEKESQMFRYEAIERGQVLIGYIQCEERYVEDFKALLGQKIFYIGGSKGSGYGKCEITYEEMDYSYEEYKEAHIIKQNIEMGTNTKEDEKKMLIYAMSDLILLDGNGMVANHIDEQYLEEILNVKNVHLESIVCDTSVTFSYNQKWKANGVQQTSVMAGSVFVYSYAGNLTLEAIKELQEKGVGLRREEGFGQIWVNPEFEQYRAFVDEKEKEEENIELNSEVLKKELKKVQKQECEEDKILIETVLESIFQKQDYDTIVYKLVPKKKASIKKEGWRLSRTQANSLKTRLDKIYDARFSQGYEEAKRQLFEYFDLRKRKKKEDGEEVKGNFTDLEATILFSEQDIPETEVVKPDWNVERAQPVSVKDFLMKMIDGTAVIYENREEWKGRSVREDSTQTEQDKRKFYLCCLYLKELVRIYLREENCDE